MDAVPAGKAVDMEMLDTQDHVRHARFLAVGAQVEFEWPDAKELSRKGGKADAKRRRKNRDARNDDRIQRLESGFTQHDKWQWPAVTTLVEHAMARVKDSQIAERLAHEMVEGAIVAALDEEAARAKKAMQVETNCRSCSTNAAHRSNYKSLSMHSFCTCVRKQGISAPSREKIHGHGTGTNSSRLLVMHTMQP